MASNRFQFRSRRRPGLSHLVSESVSTLGDVVLALLPPLAGGVGVVDKAGILIIFVTVIGLHLITVNVLYPKIVGRRIRLNPLAVTLSLLFWAWIWGAMGLLLAVPLVGATKIVCDYVDSLRGVGAWLGE